MSTLYSQWAPGAVIVRDVAGAVANTPFDVAGITTADTLIQVDKMTSNVFADDLLDEAVISSNGHVNCPSTATNGDIVRVAWVVAANLNGA